MKVIEAAKVKAPKTIRIIESVAAAPVSMPASQSPDSAEVVGAVSAARVKGVNPQQMPEVSAPRIRN